MAFTVGMKVVCVDAGPSKFSGLPTEVAHGSIYTVREYGVTLSGNKWVLLNEIDPRDPHWSFDARRFRPIVERKTDISFTAGADPESEKWDNRKPMPVYTFDEVGHEQILRYLRGFY